MRMRAAGLRLRFVIIGEGPLRGSLERAVSDARLEEVVHFAGRRTDIPRLLAGADVVALPSLHEGLGVAALEGMAAGRPVVASRVGGLAEAVLDGETGWLVPPGDAQALAERLTLVLSDVEGRRRMGGRAREWVAERYTMTRMATENERVYRMLRGNGSSDRTMGAEE
jgi:glycosyltransferase involved in cell wall biosynthesis